MRSGSTNFTPRGLFCALAVFGAAVAAGCGGGGGGGTPPGSIPTVAPTATSSSAPATLPPFTTSTQTPITIACTTPAPAIVVAIPTIDGFAGTVTLHPLSCDNSPLNLAQTLTDVTPSGLPALPASSYPVIYDEISTSASLYLASGPTFSVTLPASVSVPANTTFYLALYDPENPAAGFQDDYAVGVVQSVSPTVVTFSGPAAAFTFTGAARYVFALYARSSSATPPTADPSQPPNTPPPSSAPSAPASATPTPMPTSTATATATPAPTPTNSPVGSGIAVTTDPSPIAFTQTGQTATITVSQTGFGGNFTISSNAPTTASVSPASRAPGALGQSVTFTVTAGTISGQATITITGGNGRTATVPAGLTITSGVIK